MFRIKRNEEIINSLLRKSENMTFNKRFKTTLKIWRKSLRKIMNNSEIFSLKMKTLNYDESRNKYFTQSTSGLASCLNIEIKIPPKSEDSYMGVK